MCVHDCFSRMTRVQLIAYFQLSLKLLTGEFAYPDTSYANDIVNRNISKISQPEWQWIQENCGMIRQQAASSFKIIGGENVKPGQMPGTVLLTSTITRMIMNDRGGEEIDNRTVFDISCTGTLISKQHVITAAHCFVDEMVIGNKTSYAPYDLDLSSSGPYGTPYKAKIMIGVRVPDDDSDQTLYRQETGRFLSPDFFLNGTCNVFDYAIVEFEPQLDEKDLYIAMPACLPSRNPNIVSGTNLRIAAWGATGEKTVPGIRVLIETVLGIFQVGNLNKRDNIISKLRHFRNLFAKFCLDKDDDTDPDRLTFREVLTKECIAPRAYENDIFCIDTVGFDGDSGAGFMKKEGNRSVLVGVYEGTRHRRGRCFLWFTHMYHQDYGLILNPENNSPFPGASNSISVITEKLGCIRN